MVLTPKQEKRLKKLQQLLAKLQAGEHVQNRTLQNNLTSAEFGAIEGNRKMQEEYESHLPTSQEKPAQIIEYEERLRKAISAYNRYTSYKNRHTVKRAHNRSDGHFERLHEYLEEIIDANPRLADWFDRDIDSDSGLTPEEMPHVITSRSLDNKAKRPYEAGRVKNILDDKQAAVERAIENITNPPKRYDGSEMKAKLKQLKKW